MGNLWARNLFRHVGRARFVIATSYKALCRLTSLPSFSILLFLNPDSGSVVY